jgi:sulfite exporter TauE/SafE
MSSTWLLVIGILSSSFLGSWHCAGMCSPIASMMAQKKSLWQYHVGRMISYVALGFLGGGLGEALLDNEIFSIRVAATALMGITLCVMGLSYFSNSIKFPSAILSKLHFFRWHRSSLIVGLLTAFLPCGWLYTYAAAAVASRSPWAGALILFLFWLGGLPALSVLPMVVRKSLQQAGLRHKKIAGVILIVAGLYSLMSFYFLCH